MTDDNGYKLARFLFIKIGRIQILSEYLLKDFEVIESSIGSDQPIAWEFRELLEQLVTEANKTCPKEI